MIMTHGSHDATHPLSQPESSSQLNQLSVNMVTSHQEQLHYCNPFLKFLWQGVL